MPKRADIHCVLVIGAGPIVIGQACEFDYSGTQACRALRREGIRVVLLNSNPATIMTDPELADATYIEPINADTAAAIIKKEKVDAVLPTMGGQTALNCAIALHERGIFGEGREKDDKPILIGAGVESIHLAEDRDSFKQAMQEIGLKCSPSAQVHSWEEAQAALPDIGFPVILRPSFTLGGSGGGIAVNEQELRALVLRGLDESPSGSVLMERSLIGWKEYEMEVVRDSNDNCIIVCSIENVDPMGVHTGDSITVAPAQTLTDKEYQNMRDASIAILRKIGVDTGGSNVQFAVNPDNGEMVVIEMNPRVSRSSALASKATGFPIAKVATLLAIGYTLDEIQNDITGGKTPASFEPSIDYIVTKVPRFDFAKFSPSKDTLTTQMRSVGEAMAIGATFAESLQKALHSLDIGKAGLEGVMQSSISPLSNYGGDAYIKELTKKRWNALKKTDIAEAIKNPHSHRIFDIGDAFRMGEDIKTVHELTHIDYWFLHEIKAIIDCEQEIYDTLKTYADNGNKFDNAEALRRWKRMGFSDQQIYNMTWLHGTAWVYLFEIDSVVSIGKLRKKQGIHPVYRRIDTCAGEFKTTTAYMYSTYHYSDEGSCELNPSQNKEKVIILGSGPNRIGQGIEFDYCCVHGVKALRDANYETLMINCNPETVSTDYDTADRLFFEPLTAEDVSEIIRRENPKGVIPQFGGQTPLNIARYLEDTGAIILGTSVKAIDDAESRRHFQTLLNELNLKQPKNAIVGRVREKDDEYRDRQGKLTKQEYQKLQKEAGEYWDIKLTMALEDALIAADNIGYPLLVRPSYVLGGKAMNIVYDKEELGAYLKKNITLLYGDVLLDKFLQNAIEVDVDAVRDNTGACLVAGVMEHIERAGVHSGDSACSLPPYSLPPAVVEEIKKQTRQLANKLEVIGLMNVQFAVCDGEIYVLEVNPRASRTAPFVSKATGVPIAKIAALAMAGKTLNEQGVSEETPQMDFFAVKEAVFPFNKFPDADVLLGPEMKSTGESMGIAKDFATAYFLAQEAILSLPQSGAVAFSVRDEDKPAALQQAKKYDDLGFNLMATAGTAAYFVEHGGLTVERLKKVKGENLQNGEAHIVDNINNNTIQIMINTESNSAESRADSFTIRRAALDNKIAYFTTMAAAAAAADGLRRIRENGKPKVRSLQKWIQSVKK